MLVGENMVKEFTAGGIFQDNANVFIVLDDLFEPDNVGMGEQFEGVDFAKHFDFAAGLGRNSVLSNKLDGDLLRHLAIFPPAELDFTKLTLAKRGT